MEGLLCFLIIFVFFITSIVVLCAVFTGKKKESFENNKNYSKSKFYTYPLNKMEKLNSLYTPIICRPPEHSGLTYTGKCTNELYPKRTSPYGKGEMTAPCKPDIEAKYYAMRPLLTPNGYNEMLEILFKHIIEKVPTEIPQEQLIYQTEFCNKDCYSDVMKYILKKINYAKTNIPIFKEYAKNDTWGGEQFAFLNEKVFLYTNQNLAGMSQQDQAKLARYGKIPGHKKFVVTFTLHNTLRSTSTDLIAIVFLNKKKYYLKYINFSTKKPTNTIKGQSMVGKSGGINLNNEDIPKRDSGPNWLYGNTIQNNLFNLKGFYDGENPSNNILVSGGVPEEFKGVLDKCDQGYLMKPENAMARSKGGPLTSSGNANQTNSPIYPLFPSDEMVWPVNV